MHRKNPWLLLALALALTTAACDDDDDNSMAPPGGTDFALTITNIAPRFTARASGAFDTPVGTPAPGPVTAGGAYEFAFTAKPGDYLSFATMFVHSNDLFYAPDPEGISLFGSNGDRLLRDVTSTVALWDAGTEADEPLGAGPNQAPLQTGANTGPTDSMPEVREANNAAAPAVEDALQVTLSAGAGPNDFVARIDNVSTDPEFAVGGAFNTPVDASMAGPAGPGDAYEFEFAAAPGSKLSFATMFIPSNDFFFAPAQNGIDLFDAFDNPITGDLTPQVFLWDAGTEVNQEPGLGTDQPQRSGGTGGADPNPLVRMATDDFGNLPAVSDVIEVTLTSTAATSFMLRIENVSTSTTLMTSDSATQAVPITPGVFVVHSGGAPLFAKGSSDLAQGLEALAEDGMTGALEQTLASRSGVPVVLAPGVFVVHRGDGALFAVNEPDRGAGLEALAEDGNPAMLAASLAVAPVSTPFAPGVFAIHGTAQPLFVAGTPDQGLGLEALAEDGDPSGLAAALANLMGVHDSGVFNTPGGGTSPGPITPSGAYRFSFNASPGDRLSFATMLVQSNDVFVAPEDGGIALFDANQNPVTGDVTAMVSLWDAGTEVNEEPGVGDNQAPRQSAPNTGGDENGNVRLLDDGYRYGAVSGLVRVELDAN